MRRIVLLTGLLTPLFLAGCTEKGEVSEVGEINAVKIRFPSGFTVRAEMVTSTAEVLKGMKFRASLAADRGMLFVHGKPGNYHYWMYEVLIPLDMIWLDKDRRVVQLIHKAPPCPGPKEKCMAYGGNFPAVYILEVPAGTAAREGLKPGMQLEF
jgi:uncharacterized membrane protein (UPF0127 family)